MSSPNALPKVLTIAGSDTSAGAGMQADLKTFQELKTYGMVVLTAIVTMDKDTWSHHVVPIANDVIEKQIETVLSIGPIAIKTGMLGTKFMIEHAAQVSNEAVIAKFFIVDPVMVCKGENEVLNPDKY